MPKSISTTSNTQNAATNAPASFKAGDAVLCPTVGNSSYRLYFDDESGCLAFSNNGQTYHFRNDGKVSKHDKAPSIFHDTPANRQAVNALFGTGIAAPLVIDTTKADDKEAVILSALDLSDIACDIQGAIETLLDVGQLLGLIYRGKIEPHTAVSLARLTHDATETWADLLHSQLKNINEPLALTVFGREGE